MISYANGQYVASDVLAFPAIGDAVGSIRGFRIFTACKTVQGVLFCRAEHIDRLWDSAKMLGMELPHSQDELNRIIDEVLAKNAEFPGERLLEIFYSGGPASANGTSPIGPAQLYILTLPLKSPAPEWYSQGISLATFPFQRPFPLIKLTHYVGAIVAHQTVVKQHNAEMPLFVTEGASPEVLEGSTFNFFTVQNGEIVTPATDGRILTGITRAQVIKCARSIGLTVREQSVPLSGAWDEAFLTSSTRNVVPVVRIDSVPVGDGRVGPVTRRLMGALTPGPSPSALGEG
jgi:branched-chain amino acid aminotransferase